jgi:hypothetical protein
LVGGLVVVVVVVVVGHLLVVANDRVIESLSLSSSLLLIDALTDSGVDRSVDTPVDLMLLVYSSFSS